MLVITGIFENDRFIPDNPVKIPQKKKVVLTFEEETSTETEGGNARRNEAFQRFMQYKGILPVDFDYKKELAESRNERYGHID